MAGTYKPQSSFLESGHRHISRKQDLSKTTLGFPENYFSKILLECSAGTNMHSYQNNSNSSSQLSSKTTQLPLSACHMEEMRDNLKLSRPKVQLQK